MLKVLTPMWTKKPETARRLKQRMKVVLEWARVAGHRPADLANPVDGIVCALPNHKGDKSHHPALHCAQEPAFVETIRSTEANDVTKLAFEFLILTAA